MHFAKKILSAYYYKHTMNSDELQKIIKTESIEVIAHPNAKKRELCLNKKGYQLYIKANPENNKANEECVSYLSKLFNKEVKLVKGKTSKKKVFKIYSN